MHFALLPLYQKRDIPEERELHKNKDSDKITSSRGSNFLGVLFYTFLTYTKQRGYAMPIELLVPIVLFFGGVVVSVTLGGIGIEQVSNNNKG